MPFFRYEGQRLHYTEFASEIEPVSGARARPSGAAAASASNGSLDAAQGRPVILLHGLLLSQEMDRPLAEALAARGNRAITFDLLGHGRSDRPRDMWRYSMATFGDQVVALMDHLGLEQAVVMGTSLGANAALEVASKRPERLRGMVIEMPVLDNALLASALAFTPLLVALTFGEPIMKRLARLTRAVPRALLPHWGNVMLDLVRQEPGPGGALLQGLFFGRVAPPRSERRTFEVPTLILGHRRDPVHPFSDAGMLASEIPNARIVEANSLVELRLQPDRLTDEIARFLDQVWAPGRRARTRSASKARSTASRPKSGTRAKNAATPAKRSATKSRASRGARAKRGGSRRAADGPPADGHRRKTPERDAS
jgi:pimeloyl-ACP methyl ester carboxylesterase